MNKVIAGIVIAVIAFCPCFLNASIPAAQDPVSLSGTVTDSNGVPIPAASVRVYSGSDLLAETLTDLDGLFQFEELPAGLYQLRVEIVGFVKATRDALDVSADADRNLAIQLEPLPRPAPIKAPSEVPRRQDRTPMPESSSFQAAQVTDLPGSDLFQLGLGQETGDLNPLTSREDSLLFVSGNSASLDAGDWNDRDFREQMMDAAQQMGFQIQEFRPGGTEGHRRPLCRQRTANAA